MSPQQIPISDAGRVILNTVKDELFPLTNELKDILVQTQQVRISYQVYSERVNKLDKRYSELCTKLFVVIRKLETPDILFEGLGDTPQHMIDYFNFQQATQKSINDAVNYVEITDRTLDRKMQSIQNNRTMLVSLIAVLISIISILGPSAKSSYSEKRNQQSISYVNLRF